MAARRRKKTEISAAGFLLLVVFGLLVTYPVASAIIFAAVGLGVVAWFLNRRKESQRRVERQLNYTLAELDQLSGPEFEAWVTSVLEGAGIAAENIRDGGDFGVDVIATVGSTRIGLQVKRYSQSVGNSAVQEALAGSGYHDCSLAGVVTQSSFTPAARKQAERARVPVLLVDREGIHDLARRVREFASAEGLE